MAKFCEVCGIEIKPEDRPKGGRPSKYCEERDAKGKKVCSEFSAALTVLGRYAAGVENRATSAAWLEIRGKIFQLLNARAWNRGVPIPDLRRDKRGRFVGKKKLSASA